MDKTGRHWVSDDDDNLVQIDLQVNQLQKIQKYKPVVAMATIQLQKMGMLCTVLYDNVITRVTLGNERIDLIKTGGWAPISIYAS